MVCIGRQKRLANLTQSAACVVTGQSIGWKRGNSKRAFETDGHGKVRKSAPLKTALGMTTRGLGTTPDLVGTTRSQLWRTRGTRLQSAAFGCAGGEEADQSEGAAAER